MLLCGSLRNTTGHVKIQHNDSVYMAKVKAHPLDKGECFYDRFLNWNSSLAQVGLHGLSWDSDEETPFTSRESNAARKLKQSHCQSLGCVSTQTSKMDGKKMDIQKIHQQSHVHIVQLLLKWLGRTRQLKIYQLTSQLNNGFCLIKNRSELLSQTCTRVNHMLTVSNPTSDDPAIHCIDHQLYRHTLP